MTKGIFVTATGTDVGKTFVSALLVKKMKDFGYNCGYFKPALSGAYKKDGELIPGDCEYVLKTAGLKGNPSNFASYIFETAVSPHLASQIENNPIKLSKIKQDFEKMKSKYDYIVVEGAGGIVCPFNLTDGEKLILPDVIKALNLDVIIVASSSLGSINSAVLTSEYIKNCGICAKGFILNNYNENDFMEKDNKEQIENLSGLEIITDVKKDDKDLKIAENKLLSLFEEI